MKILKKIYSGIRLEGDKYVFDYNHNLNDDIVDLISPQIYQSGIDDNLYWFGYKFKDCASTKQRSDFIKSLKQIDNKVDDAELNRFISRPIFELSKILNRYKLSGLVYPLSGRTRLVTKIVKQVTLLTSYEEFCGSYEFVKSLPVDIEFDWEQFEIDNSDNENSYNQMKKYVETYLMPKINSLDYFSLSENVKPKYRKYIRNFLNLSEASLSKIEGIKNSTDILLIDDINTSGSTIREIVQNLRKLNNDCKIYVFTLIGRE